MRVPRIERCVVCGQIALAAGPASTPVRYLQPHLQLLLKAKGDLDKDRADLAACLPRMSGAQRSWLAGALDLAHPNHPCQELLDAE